MTALRLLEGWEPGQAIMRVSILEAWGSTPREAGAFLLVTARAQSGTIGGGRLEWDAVKRARRLLAEGGADEQERVALGPEIGQCCGGAVMLRFERIADRSVLEAQMAHIAAARPVFVLFGAGHVGRALAQSLALLPLRLIWADARGEEFGPVPDGVEARATANWEAVLGALAPGSGVIVMTQSHALDALIVGAALERGDLRYVGMIGSRTKRRQFERGFREIGIPEAQIATLICPIGGSAVRDKRPESIAALVAAEIVARFLN